jgi:hypothetical protein
LGALTLRAVVAPNIAEPQLLQNLAPCCWFR